MTQSVQTFAKVSPMRVETGLRPNQSRRRIKKTPLNHERRIVTGRTEMRPRNAAAKAHICWLLFQMLTYSALQTTTIPHHFLN